MSLRLFKALKKSKPQLSDKIDSLERALDRKSPRFITGEKVNQKLYRTRERYPSGDSFLYYYSKKYFKNKIITPEMISKLRKGAKMLSVGVGPALLERTLLAFSIPYENIDVADLELHPRIKKYPFKRYEFDMSKEWPQTAKYDYIIFPDSFQYGMSKRIYGFFGGTRREYYEHIGVEILNQAYTRLNPGGEIRISAYLPSDIAHVLLARFVHTNPKAKYFLDEEEHETIIIKKPE